jgi:hypothetical protein
MIAFLIHLRLRPARVMLDRATDAAVALAEQL